MAGAGRRAHKESAMAAMAMVPEVTALEALTQTRLAAIQDTAGSNADTAGSITNTGGSSADTAGSNADTAGSITNTSGSNADTAGGNTGAALKNVVRQETVP
eukprot:364740-Chlamydomonas_euryale.AAC.8